MNVNRRVVPGAQAVGATGVVRPFGAVGPALDDRALDWCGIEGLIAPRRGLCARAGAG